MECDQALSARTSVGLIRSAGKVSRRLRTRQTVAGGAPTAAATSLRRGVKLAGGSGVALSTIHHGAHHVLSTFRGQAGILVGVHSVLRESQRFGNISVPGPGRMDNLLKVHTSGHPDA